MAVKLSDELVERAREEAEASDRSITSQIEHWARLGQKVEGVLRHEEIVQLKRLRDEEMNILPAVTRRTLLAALRKIASESPRRELAAALSRGRTVYEEPDQGLIERIETDGTRTTGRIVNRRFMPEEARRSSRRR